MEEIRIDNSDSAIDVDKEIDEEGTCIDHVVVLWKFIQLMGYADFKQPNTLRIRVVEAKDLRSSSIRSTVSAYVKVRCGGKEEKTNVISKTTSPVWNQVSELRVF